jgi:hypothetical protein
MAEEWNPLWWIRTKRSEGSVTYVLYPHPDDPPAFEVLVRDAPARGEHHWGWWVNKLDVFQDDPRAHFADSGHIFGSFREAHRNVISYMRSRGYEYYRGVR